MSFRFRDLTFKKCFAQSIIDYQYASGYFDLDNPANKHSCG